ncbi:uncharacterized protein LOC111068652 isoform X2 [Drosophila obscura]|uniref:uncharacterized protein LOC111068652 isoform X2 n=1 Tax=Drosophila obscura TaxID=7282 RepID=UPI001BB14CE8|nr:uncharacterized protein LOC111068652 isoform X2 [Drosophila obscura]
MQWFHIKNATIKAAASSSHNGRHESRHRSDPIRTHRSKIQNPKSKIMRHLITLLGLAVVLGLAVAFVQAAPVEVVYTGESCACPTQLGYQLNVPNPPKPKKYGASDYGYRVEKPVQTKAKISYSFDFTVEQPRTPPPPKYPESKLYAKVDRVTVNKGDCAAKHTSSCSCSSCSSPKPSCNHDDGYGY